jgi:hypothetical protein
MQVTCCQTHGEYVLLNIQTGIFITRRQMTPLSMTWNIMVYARDFRRQHAFRFEDNYETRHYIERLCFHGKRTE